MVAAADVAGRGRRPAADRSRGADGPPGDGSPGGLPRQGDAPSAAAPLYPRLLRLKHLRPSAWQRAALFEGVVAASVIAVLADQASLWTIPVLPAVVAVAVKFNDLLAGLLRADRTDNNRTDNNGADPDPGRRRRDRRG